MNIPEFLDLGAMLETNISKLYATLAGLTADSLLANRLRAMAADEVNHANILRTGKTYYKEMPDLFVGVRMDEDAVKGAVGETEVMLGSISKGDALLPWLKKMLALERAFERIHLAASLEIAESSLQKLFAGLSKGDQSHIAALEEMIGLQKLPRNGGG